MTRFLDEEIIKQIHLYMASRFVSQCIYDQITTPISPFERHTPENFDIHRKSSAIFLGFKFPEDKRTQNSDFCRGTGFCSRALKCQNQRNKKVSFDEIVQLAEVLQ